MYKVFVRRRNTTLPIDTLKATTVFDILRALTCDTNWLHLLLLSILSNPTAHRRLRFGGEGGAWLVDSDHIDTRQDRTFFKSVSARPSLSEDSGVTSARQPMTAHNAKPAGFLLTEAAVEVNTLAPLLGIEKQLRDPEVPLAE